MTTKHQKIVRSSRQRDIPCGKLRINPRAQRELRQSHVDKIAAEFDPERFDPPIVNERDGHFYVMDGQHRVRGFEKWNGDGFEEQLITCQVYVGLSEREEAEMYLDLNAGRRAPRAIDAFRVALAAGRKDETTVEQVVRWQGLTISDRKQPGAIGCVTTLLNAYRRSDQDILARALRIIRDAYGDPGLEAHVIDGITHLCHRYNGQLDEAVAVKKLSDTRGGLGGLQSRAEVVKRQTGVQKAISIAAAAVDIINSGKGGKKIPGWWTA